VTCDEFRALAVTKTPADCTRAERSAAANHIRGCVPCWNWEGDTMPSVSPAEDLRLMSLAIEDYLNRDPEATL
jgi:hypothetical protein